MKKKVKKILAMYLLAFCLIPVFGIVENCQASYQLVQTQTVNMNIYSQIPGYDVVAVVRLWYDTSTHKHWVEISATNAGIVCYPNTVFTQFRAYMCYHVGIGSYGQPLPVFDEFQHVQWGTYQLSWNDYSQMFLNYKTWEGLVYHTGVSGSFSPTTTPYKWDYVMLMNPSSIFGYTTRVNFDFISDRFTWGTVVQRSQLSVGLFLSDSHLNAQVGNVYLTTTHP